jgi:hypothetical protein
MVSPSLELAGLSRISSPNRQSFSVVAFEKCHGIALAKFREMAKMILFLESLSQFLFRFGAIPSLYS